MAGRKFPARVEAVLRRLSSDRTSGASSLVELAASAFTELSSATVSTGSPALSAEVEDLCLEVLGTQPFMAPLYHLCARVLGHAGPKRPVPEMKRGISRSASHFAEGSAAGLERAAAQGARLVLDGGRLLTLSSSAAVGRSLELAAADRKRFTVTVLESRPMLEGRNAAARLAGAGIPVELSVDAAMVSEVRRADRVIVGADALTEEVLVNKCGTLALAVVAREYGVPVLAVAEGSKLLPNALLPEADRHRDPREVWDAAPPGVAVRNRYFERVPLAQVARIALEDGPADAREVRRRLERPDPALAALGRLLGEKGGGPAGRGGRT